MIFKNVNLGVGGGSILKIQKKRGDEIIVRYRT